MQGGEKPLFFQKIRAFIPISRRFSEKAVENLLAKTQ
jgi:hypothetical protein